MSERFDSEAVYDSEIFPLMTQIIEKCRAAGIPFLASFCYAYDDEEGAHFCTTKIPIKGRTPDAHERAWRELNRSGGMVAVTIIQGPER